VNAPATAADAPEILRFEGVGKRFGDLEVLRDVSFAVRRGECVCVIGPSGSGKSTLLRCANALEPVNGGRILFEGAAVDATARDVPRVRRRMGMVFQSFELFPHLTALQNVAVGPRVVLGASRAAAGELASRLLAKVWLTDKADAYPAALSGGQQQRVAIARALAMSPELMLFDEPTSALDPETIGEVLSVMRQLALEGMTMLVVIHEMTFARRVADRVVVMDHGAVVEEGSPAQVFDAPSSARTRTFLGHLGWNDR
jgi:polar amino acid transport system ATP-binding protein